MIFILALIIIALILIMFAIWFTKMALIGLLILFGIILLIWALRRYQPEILCYSCMRRTTCEVFKK